MLDVWLLLCIPYPGLYNKTHIQSIYRAIKRKPLFCKLTNINIGKYFLNLLDKHLNRDNLFRKLFYRKTVKISYSCTKKMHSILYKYNRRLQDELNRNGRELNVASCNCRSTRECPMSGRCNSKNVIYQAYISPM